MGFIVIVEAGFGDGFVASRLPTKEGGKAVFAFLGVLDYYCADDEAEDTGLIKEWRKWFKQFEAIIDQPLSEVFKPTLDCMWGDGGGIGGEFLEDEYEWYIKRNAGSSSKMTEIEFRQFIEAGAKRWSPINKVLENVKLLVDVFQTAQLSDKEALYIAQDTVPDFKSLHETLLIFENFGYETVRLNFS